MLSEHRDEFLHGKVQIDTIAEIPDKAGAVVGMVQSDELGRVLLEQRFDVIFERITVDLGYFILDKDHQRLFFKDRIDTGVKIGNDTDSGCQERLECFLDEFDAWIVTDDDDGIHFMTCTARCAADISSPVPGGGRRVLPAAGSVHPGPAPG